MTFAINYFVAACEVSLKTSYMLLGLRNYAPFQSAGSTSMFWPLLRDVMGFSLMLRLDKGILPL